MKYLVCSFSPLLLCLCAHGAVGILPSTSGPGGDAGGTNSRQYGSQTLTNWSNIPTGSMASADYVRTNTSRGIYYVNAEDNLSDVLTNLPNNSKLIIGKGNWTNRVSHMFNGSSQLGDFYLRNKTNIDIEAIGEATLWNTNRGDGLNITNCMNIRVKGLRFFGWRTTNSVLGTNFGSIIVSSSRNVYFDRMDFKNSGATAIFENPETPFQNTNIVVENSTFFNGGSFFSDTVLNYEGMCVVFGSYWTVRNNRFIECAFGTEAYGALFQPVVCNSIVEGNYYENMIHYANFGSQTNNYGHIYRNNYLYWNDSMRTVSSNTIPGTKAFALGAPHNYVIEGNTIIGLMTASPIGFGGAQAIYLNADSLDCFNVIIRNNTITNCEGGIWILNSSGKIRGVTISGNHIYQTYYAAIELAASESTVEYNTIENPEQGGDNGHAGIWLSPFGVAGTNNIVRNNIVRGTPGATLRRGIVIDAAAQQTRIWDNYVSSDFATRIIDNGSSPIPSLLIEMVTGIKTNPFTIFGTNGQFVMSIDERGFITVPNTLTNRAPTRTNTIAYGAESLGGFNLPNWTDHNGLQARMQPFLGEEHVYLIGPYAGTTIGGFGVAVVTNGGCVISHPAPVESQIHLTDFAAPATSNGCASVFSSTALANAGAHNGSSKIGGWFFSSTWYMTNLIAQVIGGGAPRTFIGLTAKVAEDYTNIVVTTNSTGQYVGLMCDTKQSTNMFISSRDASAEFRTNTGLPFIATNAYKFYMFNAPTSRFLSWQVIDAYSGASAYGWFSNNVPTNFMAFGGATKNGTNRAHGIRLRAYLQAPLSPPR